MNIAEQRRLTALDFAIRTVGHHGQDQVLAAADKYPNIALRGPNS